VCLFISAYVCLRSLSSPLLVRLSDLYARTAKVKHRGGEEIRQYTRHVGKTEQKARAYILFFPL